MKMTSCRVTHHHEKSFHLTSQVDHKVFIISIIKLLFIFNSSIGKISRSIYFVYVIKIKQFMTQ